MFSTRASTFSSAAQVLRLIIGTTVAVAVAGFTFGLWWVLIPYAALWLVVGARIWARARMR